MELMIKEIRHFGISVKNIEKALKFYRDLLGLEIMREMDEHGNYIDNMLNLKNVKVKTVKLSCNGKGTIVELLEFKSHKSEIVSREIFDFGASHIAFTVENIEKTYKYLLNNGVKFNAIPQTSPDGYAKVTFCFDPDGTPVELVEVMDSVKK